VVRRLLLLPVLMVGVTLLVFALMHLMPGDPAELIAEGKYGRYATDAEVERVRSEQWLDRPLPAQYVRWVGGVLQGDLGRSVRTGEPVTREIARRWPATVALAAAAIAMAALVGIPWGAACAAGRGSVGDLSPGRGWKCNGQVRSGFG
jgi:peptide/nickel transport system permease protein